MLDRRQLVALEDAWARGLAAPDAATFVDCSVGTVRTYFRRFADLGKPRAEPHPRRGRPFRRPRYTGPTWIGKPA